MDSELLYMMMILHIVSWFGLTNAHNRCSYDLNSVFAIFGANVMCVRVRSPVLLYIRFVEFKYLLTEANCICIETYDPIQMYYRFPDEF